MAGVSAEHTSVPQWPVEPPQVDSRGQAFYVVSCGEEARVPADGWVALVDELSRPVRHYHGEAGADWLARRLSVAHVGLRVMLAGPELEVLDMLRAAREAGMIDAEIRMLVTDSAQRRVYCPHCGTHSVDEVAVGELVACDGCGRRLIVYHHVSRTRGAYLGYMFDAEEPAA